MPGRSVGTGALGSTLTCGQGLHPAGQHPCVLASKLASNWGPDCGQASLGPGCKWLTQMGWCHPRLCCSRGFGGASDPGGGAVSCRSQHPSRPISQLPSACPPRGQTPGAEVPPEPPAVHTCPLRGAAAVVGVHAVHTGASVLAAVPWTVVNVFLAVLASEACSRGRSPGQAAPRGQTLTVLSRSHWALAPSWLGPGHPALGGELLSTACPVTPTALEP